MVNIEIVQDTTVVEVATSGVQGAVGPQGQQGEQGLKGDPGTSLPAPGLPVLETNLIPNPSFEVSTTTGGWSSPNITDRTIVAGGPFGNAVRLAGATVASARFEFVSTTALAPGNYVISIYYMLEAVGGTTSTSTFGQVLGVESGTTIVLGLSANTINNAPVGVWQRMERSFTIPEGVAQNIRVRWYIGGHTVQFDGAQLETGTVASAYVDGNQLGARWTGAAHNSSSELVFPRNAELLAPVTAHELLPDPHPVYLKKAGDTSTGEIFVDNSTYAFRWRESDQAADQRDWRIRSVNGVMRIGAWNDTATETVVFEAARDASYVILNGIRYAKGTGSPEGVITAPVGSHFADTAATNGAVEWVKASGAGNTGWRVISGDTGWQTLTLLNGWTNPNPSYSAIRREGANVTVRIRNLTGAAATSGAFANVPTGFIPPIASGGIVASGTTAAHTLSVNTSGGVAIGASVTGGASYTTFVGGLTEISYLVDSTWPASLVV